MRALALLCAIASSAIADKPPAVRFSTETWQGVTLDVVAVDLRRARLGLVWQRAPGQAFGSLRAARDELTRRGEPPLALTNAGIYGRDDRPLGLHIEGGHELHPLELRRARGNFYLEPNGVFLLEKTRAGASARVLESHEFAAWRSKSKHAIELATQSGPLLVRAGALHPRFTPGSPNTKLRSGVGVRSPTEIVLVVARGAINFHDFATFFSEKLACPDALYLDGTISRLHAPALGRSADDLLGDGHFVGILAVLPKKGMNVHSAR